MIDCHPQRRATDRDLGSTDCDSESTDCDSESTDCDSESTDCDSESTNIAQTLAAAPNAHLRRDMEVLLGHVMNVNRAYLITHGDQPVPFDFEPLRQRLLAGEPVAYLTGTREFYSREFMVTPDVLVPRPETELVVDLALEHLDDDARVLDLGTGSGAIAVSIAAARRCSVTATDHSCASLNVAQHNARRHGCHLDLVASDWFGALNERFDVIVANPPYVAADDPHLRALTYEPQYALIAGPRGLEALEVIIREAPVHTNPGGWLILEHGWDQADEVVAMFSHAGFSAIETVTDLARLPRVTLGRYEAIA